MNNYALFLDDERFPEQVTWVDLPKHKYTIVRNYNEFIRTVETNGLPVFVSFDNDLGEQKEGYDCAKWLVNYCLDNSLNFPTYTVHSKNPIASERISSIIENYKRLFNR